MGVTTIEVYRPRSAYFSADRRLRQAGTDSDVANFKSFYPDSGEVCYNSFANVAEVQLVSGVHGVKFVVGSAV